LFRALIIAVTLLVSGSALSADLGSDYAPLRACLISSDSDILELDFADLKAELSEHLSEAETLASDPAVIASNSAAFDWAIAATVQCNIALGYLKGGHVDDTSAQKCDCFHAHMLSTL
jgi:hypothetical protein